MRDDFDHIARILSRMAIVAAALSVGFESLAGTIMGTVEASNPVEGAGGVEAGGSYGSRRYKFLDRVDYEQLTDFIIFIDGVEQPAPADQPPVTIIAQKDGSFIPRIMPVVVGTVVEWPNLDDIYHNVFSMSETTPFDLGLYKKSEQAKRVRFAHRGRVDVFCSIHTKMNCVVLVLPNPWFARADARGRFTIEHIPAGTYTLKAWHERLPPQTMQVTVSEAGETSVSFVLGLGGLPKL